MKRNVTIAAMVALAGLAAPTFAQDSTSTNSDGGNGLPGDALSATVAGSPNQRAQYVVDLTPFFGSWSTRLGIAPIIKSTKSSNTFFTSQLSAQAISQTQLTNRPFPFSSYAAWNVAGGGLNPTQNNLALNLPAVSPLGTSTQFGAAVSEFGTDSLGRASNNVLTAVINYDPASPARLYVNRTVAATATPADSGPATSSFGLGMVDANGNVYFRADNFGTPTTAPNRITGNNYFRVRSLPVGAFLGRVPGTVNQISNLGGIDASATDGILRGSTATHNTPNAIPSELAATARGTLIGSNFNREYVYESSSLTTSTATSHRSTCVDHRGNVAFSKHVLRGGVATSGMIGKNNNDPAPAGSSANSENILIWGVTANGAPINPARLQVPRGGETVIADPCYSYSWPINNGDFRGYSGSVAFRGGNGGVAIGKDQAGRGLVAALSSDDSITNPNNPPDVIAPDESNGFNAIVVARFDTANPAPTAQWIVAGWIDPNNPGSNTDPDNGGKPILGDYGNDGVAFTNDPGEFDGVIDTNPASATYDLPIGRMAWINQVNSTLIGPSISSPAFDSVGNLYFVSAVALRKVDRNGNPFVDMDSALIRAVYDPANFCYRLELIAELGDSFRGQNSGLRWRIDFLSVAAAGSRPNASSFFSGNVSQNAWNNIDSAQLATNDPRTLGGLVLSASITYDVDGDGDYENPTSTGGNTASRDEAYNVLLYLGNIQAPTCPADFNLDGFVDFFDFDDFVLCFEGGACPDGRTADFNNDGFVDFFDFDDFVIAFETGCE